MQETYAFEYAVIRYVPRVEREEFVNIGVILYCKDLRFLKAKFTLDREKINCFRGASANLEEVEQNLNAFLKISNGEKNSGPIGELSMPERFRWLTAIRSTTIQTSRIHPGRCSNPNQALDEIFEKMVM